MVYTVSGLCYTVLYSLYKGQLVIQCYTIQPVSRQNRHYTALYSIILYVPWLGVSTIANVHCPAAVSLSASAQHFEILSSQQWHLAINVQSLIAIKYHPGPAAYDGDARRTGRGRGTCASADPVRTWYYLFNIDNDCNDFMITYSSFVKSRVW